MCLILVILVPLTLGIGAESKSQQCMDSMGRAGNCAPLNGCPFLLDEFYEKARQYPEGIDFQSFISQSLCGFDGFRFLICCTIRSNVNNQQQQQPQQQQQTAQSSSLFHFVSLGNQMEPPQTIAPMPNPIPTSPTNAPWIVAPIPSQQLTTKSPQDTIVVVINPAPLNPSPPSQISLPPIVKSNDPQNGQCGVSNVFTNRVVGGVQARKGAYPWMAALGYIEPAQGNVLKFLCSGSLISRTHVITAAHCINPSLSIVRLGAHDITKTEASAVDAKIKRIIVHEKFDLKTISNDIALIQLNDPVSFTEFISPICLPEDMKFIQQNFVGNNPFIAGWGTIQFQGATSNVLRDAQVPIIDTKSCMANYSTVYRPVEVTETLICAGSYITDACQGDSGGPMMMPQLEDRIFRYYIIGLVSYGYECARAGFPGVYTRVAAYMQWIKNNMMTLIEKKKILGDKKKIRKLEISARNKMNLFISLIGLACVVAPGLAQRTIRQGQQCYTPENDIGQCFTLSYCPAIANVLNEYPRNIATQYLRTAQRNCGNVNFRGDPVVCCNVNQQQQFETPPTTSNPRNPFFPTAQPTTLPPIIINPTPAPPPPPRQTTTTTTNAPVASTTEGISNREEKSGRECRGPDLKYGTCIPLSQCPTLIERLRANPKDATFANYLRASNDVCKGEYAVVCCPSTNQKQIMEVVFPKNTGAIPTKLYTKADGCGYTSNKFKKIVGGVASKVGAWPWIALLGYEDGVSPKSFKCGGALITSRHVLTAAHCIRKDLTSVRLGEHDLNSETEANHVDIPVVKRLRHPNYVPAYGHNDIAMLYLGQTVQFSENISPICIPTDPQLRAKDLTTLNPFVAGWGKTQEGGVSANILQELQIPIFGNDECKELYRKQNKLIADDQFDNAVLCAGNLAGGKDTCQGDSGGPLMLPESYGDSFRFNLIGIVSYGIGCARPLIPGVYARVTNFIEWIENSVADTSSF
ncbi:uncharacterized protein LOC129908281 [Episyrphus balteatus]|uniref:uncharacterized protein LOC129908281 n=1 Tax=Episyrphus balteatus TaxID=286459 RepID=UPI0024859B3B|nr:uncharacterized protein LOC129908281 [Episyrphus balteatus]